MVAVGVTQMSLVNYLIGQLLLSESDRVKALREFAPIGNGFRLADDRPASGCR